MVGFSGLLHLYTFIVFSLHINVCIFVDYFFFGFGVIYTVAFSCKTEPREGSVSW